MPVEMMVDSVRIDLLARHRFVVLKEPEQDRYLPIAIGAAEAGAIAIKLMNAHVLRPLTHDLICSVVATLGGQVTRILITDVMDGVFYARIVLDVAGRHVEVDSRPSDAIALAVRLGTPIFVDERVLSQASVAISGEDVLSGGQPRRDASVPPDDVAGPTEHVGEEQLSAYRDVISGLNLEGLGD